jgi:hypothetical protein
LFNSTNFKFESKIQVCLYKTSITGADRPGRYHAYRQIDEIFLPQYNICLNEVDDSNIFVCHDRYKLPEHPELMVNYKPSVLQSITIIDVESELELHQILCNLMKSYVDFNKSKSSISHMFEVIKSKSTNSNMNKN